MDRKLLALYSLKYNPFVSDVPTEALFATPEIEQFVWRIEQQLKEGGFAFVNGEPGTGKSVVLRILRSKLGTLRDTSVGILTRPQATLTDFYREMGEIYGVAMRPHNRWSSTKVLREKWIQHIDQALSRPVLLIDEAQEMKAQIFCELRILSNADLDARSNLTVVMAGDGRMAERLGGIDLLPIASRIRARLQTDAASTEDLRQCLRHLLQEAGNPNLMSSSVEVALTEHACGNYRLMMNMANDLLNLAVRREARQIDDKLYFEAFSPTPKSNRGNKK